jgi:membrane-associated phospholipid phosphatase
MDPIWQWGLTIILAIQSIRTPALDAFFKAVTALGSEDFFMVLVPLTLWCLNLSAGIRLSVALVLGVVINDGLKTLFTHPRPFDLDPSVGLYPAEGYGFPSGHAQMSVVIWGVLAAEIRKRWAWITAVILMVLIGFSRIYLGVHFPTDVLAGWAVGTLVLIAYIGRLASAERWLTSLKPLQQIALTLTVSLGLVLLMPTLVTTSILGVLAGAGVGFVLMSQLGGYRADGPVWQRAVRFVIGGAVLFGLRIGLKAILPDADDPFYLAMRFVRYAVMGLWTGLGAPLLFQKLRLAPEPQNPNTK